MASSEVSESIDSDAAMISMGDSSVLWMGSQLSSVSKTPLSVRDGGGLGYSIYWELSSSILGFPFSTNKYFNSMTSAMPHQKSKNPSKTHSNLQKTLKFYKILSFLLVELHTFSYFPLVSACLLRQMGMILELAVVGSYGPWVATTGGWMIMMVIMVDNWLVVWLPSILFSH